MYGYTYTCICVERTGHWNPCQPSRLVDYVFTRFQFGFTRFDQFALTTFECDNLGATLVDYRRRRSVLRKGRVDETLEAVPLQPELRQAFDLLFANPQSALGIRKNRFRNSVVGSKSIFLKVY